MHKCIFKYGHVYVNRQKKSLIETLWLVKTTEISNGQNLIEELAQNFSGKLWRIEIKSGIHSVGCFAPAPP